MVKDVESNTLRKKTTAKKSKLQSFQRTPNVVVLLLKAVYHSRKCTIYGVYGYFLFEIMQYHSYLQYKKLPTKINRLYVHCKT